MTIPATTAPPPSGMYTPNVSLHPVANKLRQQVLPYTESAKLLNRQWFYRAHQLFGYATDITVALAAIGIGLPLLTALTPNAEGRPAGAAGHHADTVRSQVAVLARAPVGDRVGDSARRLQPGRWTEASGACKELPAYAQTGGGESAHGAGTARSDAGADQDRAGANQAPQ